MPFGTGKEAALATKGLRKTLALYRGDFVQEYPSEAYMQRERDRLRDG